MSDLPPIACTLDAGASRARWQSWARLDPTSRLVEAGHDRLVFRFPEEVRDDLLNLVEAERDCCGFVDWDITPAGNDLQLTISGDEMGMAAISAQFGVEPDN